MTVPFKDEKLDPDTARMKPRDREVGHDYYFHAHHKLSYLHQNGANGGSQFYRAMCRAAGQQGQRCGW